ncbi:hypothetical protein VIGAN_UM019000, partial [Vigna angularis var. angularis]
FADFISTFPLISFLSSASLNLRRLLSFKTYYHVPSRSLSFPLIFNFSAFLPPNTLRTLLRAHAFLGSKNTPPSARLWLWFRL